MIVLKPVTRTICMLIILVLSIHLESKATHGIGGEIAVSHIVNNTYRVTLSLYRDCSGITLPNTQTINLSPTNSGSTITLNRISVTDITSVCATQSTKCTNSSSSVNGVEEHVYSAAFNFNPLPLSLPQYTLTWTGCCRPNGISNLVTPGGQGTTLMTKLYRAGALPDNTPELLNPPTSQYCLGQLATVSVNAYDADGDVIRYKLVDALGQAATPTPVSYISPYSGINPLPSSTPITIDSLTGLMTFTPTAVGRYIVTIQATEFRGGVEYGFVRREVELVVTNCGSNSVPVITPINNAVVSDGSLYCVPVVVTDADNDSISLSALSAIIPPATFIIDSAIAGATYGTFCFLPTVAHRGNTFAVSFVANDKICPVPASAVSTFNITVPIVCSLSLSTSSTPTATGQSTGSATASVGNGVQPYSYSWSGPNNFISTSDTITNLAEGIYYINVTDGNNCARVDSVVINGGASTLPVRFIDFTAVHENDYIALQFKTANEYSVRHFEMERSVDGLTYEEIGTIMPKGDGSYDFRDKDVEQGRQYYYRVKEISKDGQTLFSNIVAVQSAGKQLIKIHPTLISHNEINITGMFDFRQTDFSLFDITGRKLFATKVKKSKVLIPNLASGNYVGIVTRNGVLLNRTRITIK